MSEQNRERARAWLELCGLDRMPEIDSLAELLDFVQAAGRRAGLELAADKCDRMFADNGLMQGAYFAAIEIRRLLEQIPLEGADDGNC